MSDDLKRIDDLAERLTAMGEVLAASVVFVASVDLQWSPAFRALADAVEKAQPGAVAVTRKALGR